MTKWTTNQKKAIDSQGSNVLVSAAAGSGKTSVLCERIMRQLTEDSDISRMLVVTFTRAAAASLQEKLRKNLRAAMKADPANRHLARQYLALPHAKIGTIHSFCLDIVRENSTALSLPPKIRMMDEVESHALCHKIMEQVLHSFYVADNPAVIALFDQLTSHDEAKLESALLSLYYKAISTTKGLETIKENAAVMDNVTAENLFSTTFGKIILDNFKDILSHYHNVLTQALSHFELCEHQHKSNHNQFNHDLQLINALINDLASDQSYSAILSRLDLHQSQDDGRLKSEYKDEYCVYFRKQRKDFLAYIKSGDSKRSKIGLSFDSREISKDAQQSADLLHTLHRVLSVFDLALTEEKRNRGVVDFADLEQHTFNLLVNDGLPTPLAENIATQFDHVYIDEYQDTNYTQDAIFRAIGRDNLFMVGDVKQSIYGFRGARPDIFAGYRDRYTDDGSGEGQKIFLSDNFRSAHPIIRACNAIFSRLLPLSKEIGYVPEDDLAPSSSRPETYPVELHICPNDLEEADVVADLVAQHIATGTKPQEIAILMRSPKTSAPAIVTTLTARGVPVGTSEELGFWEREDIRTLRCLLETVDNPASDVYTAGALRSHMFGLRLEDLATIRQCEGKNLYENAQAFVHMGEAPLHVTVKSFLDFMESARREGASLPLTQQIYNIIIATFGSTAMCDSQDLLQFFAVVRQYESNASSCPDLSGLLNHIRKLSEGTRNRKNEPSKSGVNIMSTHASKGLEFPVVILCSMGRALGGSKTVPEFAYHGQLGFAPRLPDRQMISRRDSVFGVAAALLQGREDVEEEVRNLYVALTRAEGKLMLVGKTPKTTKELPNITDIIARYRMSGEFLSHHQLDKCDTFLQWTLMALPPQQEGSEYTLHISTTLEEATQTAQQHQNFDTFNLSEDDRKIIESRLNFSYPHQHLTSLPTKLSVSRLYPGILDEREESTPIQVESSFRTPLFLQENPVEETARLAGLATHAFMQFCDFDQIKRHGVELELHRLTSGQFISPQAAARVQTDKLKTFFASPLYSEMSAAPELYRERRFNVWLPASDFATDQENVTALADQSILVQGVVDCYFVDARGLIHLVDYKTDSFPAGMPREKIEEQLRYRHGQQLDYYRRALEELTGRRVSQTLIYSFHLGDVVECL